jgi:hypothetical protein
LRTAAERLCKHHASIILRLAAAQLYEAIVMRFAAAVAAGLCFRSRILPELVIEYRQHFRDLPIVWLVTPRT